MQLLKGNAEKSEPPRVETDKKQTYKREAVQVQTTENDERRS